MLDLLRATSLIYGDCTQEPNSSDIYISTGKLTAEQMIAITAKATELQAEYDNKEYQRNRAAAYPSFADQADMQYWDKVNGTNNWETTIAAIKAKYPNQK
jgi:hypothetical protein